MRDYAERSPYWTSPKARTFGTLPYTFGAVPAPIDSEAIEGQTHFGLLVQLAKAGGAPRLAATLYALVARTSSSRSRFAVKSCRHEQ